MKWFASEFKGVRYRKHPTRKHGVQPDKYYVITYKLDGKTKTEAIGWASEKIKPSDAYNILQELKGNQKKGAGPRTYAEKKSLEQQVRQIEAARNTTLSQYWPVYFKHAQLVKLAHVEESHFKNWLQPNLGHIVLNEIGVHQWDMLVATLHKTGRSRRTIEYVTGTLRRILKHAYERRLITEAPPSAKRVGVTSPGNSNRRLRVIRPDEAEQILETIRQFDENAYRLTKFAFLTGCRASEAFNLRWRDVDFIRGVLTFPETKNRDTRIIPISPPLADLLQGILLGEPEQHVFPMSNGKPYREAPATFKTVVDKLEMNKGRHSRDRITFHTIRHSVATELAKRLTLRDLMDVMGWRTVQMAMRYVHGDEKAKTNALASLELALKPQPAKIVQMADKKQAGATGE